MIAFLIYSVLCPEPKASRILEEFIIIIII